MAKVTKKGEHLIEDYKIARLSIANSLGLTSITNGNIKFSFENDNDPGFIIMPYVETSSGRYLSRSIVHYINLHLESFPLKLREVLMNKDKRTISKNGMIIRDLLLTSINGNKAKTQVMANGGKKIYDISLTSKMFKRLKVRLIYQNRSLSLLVGGDEDGLSTNERLTLYAIKELLEESINPTKLDGGYSLLKTSIMNYRSLQSFINIFKEDHLISHHGLEALLDMYLDKFDKAKSLVSDQIVFKEDEYEVDYNLTSTAQGIKIPFNTKFDTEEKDYETSLDAVIKKKEKKGKDMVFMTGEMGEKEFKEMVKERLVSHKYEPVSFMSIDGSMPEAQRWTREVAYELKTSMLEMGTEPHMSVSLTLGDILIEEVMSDRSGSTPNVNNMNMGGNMNMGNGMQQNQATANGFIMGGGQMTGGFMANSGQQTTTTVSNATWED